MENLVAWEKVYLEKIDSSKEKLFGWKDPSFHGGNV